ncbi:ribonuclease P protein component 4 [Podospora fimiseda]|uniref:Ribonuclease P protein component 4 n=1 Tax=Podospora fimiseda TaxID=252190 RepID=A0AAN7BT15_9PEZI|nr:ribonuclease P protein component 4 [Podospora fimiseda]
MAKGGNKNGGGGVQNKAIYSRVSFLQQASVFLSSAPSSSPQSSPPLQGMGRRLATDLRAVSLKTRIRLNPAVKRTICKFCDSVLIDGQSCTITVENKSKGGKKPWADNIVRKCLTCGKERRYPVSAPRTKRKTDRFVVDTNAEQNEAGAEIKTPSG